MEKIYRDEWIGVYRMKNFLIVILTCIYICLLFDATTYALSFEANPDGIIWENGNLIVNGRVVETDDSIIFHNNKMRVPLRTVFEALGAIVEWDNDTREVSINYKGVQYSGRFIAPSGDEYLYIRDTRVPLHEEKMYEDAKLFGFSVDTFLGNGYIQLNPTGYEGAFTFVNDRIYLWRDTAERLLEYMSVDIEVNYETKTLVVTSAQID